MAKCGPRKYSDGGKVLEREYGGKPTFLKSVAAKVGIGDGYSYSPPKAKAKKAERMDVSNVTTKLPETLANRKKMLDEYKDGGKVKKRGC